MNPRIIACYAVSCGLAACNIELPEESLIVDPRILALRAVPADATGEPAPLAAIAVGTAIDIEVLAVEPAGLLEPAQVEAQWFACPLAPGQPAFSCLQAALPLELDALAPCPMAAESPLVGPCNLGVGLDETWMLPPPLPEQRGFTVSLVLAAAPVGEVEQSRCVTALLRGDYDTPDACRYASYAVGRAELAGPSALNAHPSSPTVGVQVLHGDDVVGESELGSASTIEISRDQELALVPRLAADDEQSYDVPQNDGQATARVTEQIRATWFRTDGMFVGAAMGPPLGAGLEQTWRPGDSEAARIYLVLRDGRGGVAWWWIDVTVANA